MAVFADWQHRILWAPAHIPAFSCNTALQELPCSPAGDRKCPYAITGVGDRSSAIRVSASSEWRFAAGTRGGAEIELTTLFADLRGSTAMSERLSPGEFAAAMNRFYVSATDVLIRTDAYVDKVVGDEVVGVYFPLFAGRAYARRALEAAWALLRAASYDNVGRLLFPFGVGVHTGTAFVGTVTGAEGTVTDIAAVGHDVNLTARLSSAASAGEALISEAACRASGLDLDHLSPRQVESKGHSELLDVRVMRVG